MISWLLQQMRGAVTISDISRRDDATKMHIPADCKDWVTGSRDSELRRVNSETGVHMFIALDGEGEERLAISSQDPGSKASPRGRAAAEGLARLLELSIQGANTGSYTPVCTNSIGLYCGDNLSEVDDAKPSVWTYSSVCDAWQRGGAPTS